jgi:wyosine [tRNA(Phe)-imidazoG37] synthetase (radical SAM superfamily)
VIQFLKENSDAFLREMTRAGVPPKALYATLRNTLDSGVERLVEIEKVAISTEGEPELDPGKRGEWLEDLTHATLQIATAAAMMLECLPKPPGPVLTLMSEKKKGN